MASSMFFFLRAAKDAIYLLIYILIVYFKSSREQIFDQVFVTPSLWKSYKIKPSRHSFFWTLNTHRHKTPSWPVIGNLKGDNQINGFSITYGNYFFFINNGIVKNEVKNKRLTSWNELLKFFGQRVFIS